MLLKNIFSISNLPICSCSKFLEVVANILFLFILLNPVKSEESLVSFKYFVLFLQS